MIIDINVFIRFAGLIFRGIRMKKYITYIYTVVITAFIILSACFALGAFGGDGLKSVVGQDYPAGGFSYSGKLKDGYFDGNGSIVFDEGDAFIGNFTDGRPDGAGVFIKKDENGVLWRFASVFENGAVKNGTFLSADGETVTYKRGAVADTLKGPDWQYTGTFNMSGQHGAGMFTFYDGSVYSGGFFMGLAYGDGAYTDASGRLVYLGGFREGLYDGYGNYFSDDGWSYEGGFKDGLFDGEGVITTQTAVIYGTWEKGVQIKRHG